METPHAYIAPRCMLTARRLATILALGISLVALHPLRAQVAKAYTVPPAPPASISRYMATVDPSTLYNEGCDQGTDATNRHLSDEIVVLDFGQPDVGPDGTTQGAYLFNNTFASTTQISIAAKSFADGFWSCTPVNGPYLILAVGTNNEAGALANDPTAWFNHGKAWSGLVNNLGDYMSASGYNSQENPAGADDMETGWGGSNLSAHWADGFAAVPQYWNYYDYGDAGGCPPTVPALATTVSRTGRRPASTMSRGAPRLPSHSPKSTRQAPRAIRTGRKLCNGTT